MSPDDWDDWVPKQVVTKHKLFTGFSDGGNGFELLLEINDNGGDARGKGDEIVFRNRDGDDVTWARPGDWVIYGTRGEFYPVTAEVHGDKYERRSR